MTEEKSVLLVTGSMFGRKSKFLMDMIEISHKDNNTKYLVFKPTKDTRDGLYIQSRVYDRVVPALAWDQNYEDMQTIFNYTISGFALTNPDEYKFVYFDEAHFISLYDMKFIVDTCQKYGINLIIAGLETSFKQDYFESVKWLKDNYNHLFYNGRCNGCDEDNAIFNVLYDQDGNIVKDGETIQPGDQEYKVYCQSCFDTL